MTKPDWTDAFLWLVPFSLVGAIFGDAIRKDVLTKRQRVAAGLFCLAVGPIAGLVAIREFHFSDVTALGVSSVVPTLAYDVIGLLVALLRWAKDNPDTLRDLWPWGRKP